MILVATWWLILWLSSTIRPCSYPESPPKKKAATSPGLSSISTYIHLYPTSTSPSPMAQDPVRPSGLVSAVAPELPLGLHAARTQPVLGGMYKSSISKIQRGRQIRVYNMVYYRWFIIDVSSLMVYITNHFFVILEINEVLKAVWLLYRLL